MRVLHLLDLVDSDPSFNALGRSSVSSTGVDCSAHITIIALYQLAFVILVQGWTWERWLWGFLAQWESLLHCLTRTTQWSTHLQVWTAPLLFHESVSVHVGLHLVHDDSFANGDEITLAIVGKGVTVHQVLQSASCITCTFAQPGSTHSGGALIHVEKNWDGNIWFHAFLLSWEDKACTNDRPVKSSECRLARGRYFETNELGIREQGLNGVGKWGKGKRRNRRNF